MKKWKYYIVLNNGHEDLVEATEREDLVDGLPLCQDYNSAKWFDSPEELLDWVKNNTSLSVDNGNEDFHIEAHYETVEYNS